MLCTTCTGSRSPPVLLRYCSSMPCMVWDASLHQLPAAAPPASRRLAVSTLVSMGSGALGARSGGPANPAAEPRGPPLKRQRAGSIDAALPLPPAPAQPAPRPAQQGQPLSESLAVLQKLLNNPSTSLPAPAPAAAAAHPAQQQQQLPQDAEALLRMLLQDPAPATAGPAAAAAPSSGLQAPAGAGAALAASAAAAAAAAAAGASAPAGILGTTDTLASLLGYLTHGQGGGNSGAAPHM